MCQTLWRVKTIYWSNLNTPNVGFVQDAQDPALIHVTAPDIAEDSVLVFQARVKPDTAQENIPMVLLVEPAPVMSQDYRRLFSDRLSRTQAYLPESPYSDDLAYCVLLKRALYRHQCSFLKLPLLGQTVWHPPYRRCWVLFCVSSVDGAAVLPSFLRFRDESGLYASFLGRLQPFVIADDQILF